MAFKPNYRQQRGDRCRAKAEKQQEKLQRRDEAAAKRRAERGDPPPAESEMPEGHAPATSKTQCLTAQPIGIRI